MKIVLIIIINYLKKLIRKYAKKLFGLSNLFIDNNNNNNNNNENIKDEIIKTINHFYNMIFNSNLNENIFELSNLNIINYDEFSINNETLSENNTTVNYNNINDIEFIKNSLNKKIEEIKIIKNKYENDILNFSNRLKEIKNNYENTIKKVDVLEKENKFLNNKNNFLENKNLNIQNELNYKNSIIKYLEKLLRKKTNNNNNNNENSFNNNNKLFEKINKKICKKIIWTFKFIY